jgi:hypothetical protein
MTASTIKVMTAAAAIGPGGAPGRRAADGGPAPEWRAPAPAARAERIEA